MKYAELISFFRPQPTDYSFQNSIFAMKTLKIPPKQTPFR